ncbi:Protein of unknown function (DUF1659) [Desulfitobacterium dichloroeliminans LMG P-21439]|uniref:DUF1659 domain-containing protein n=1 Tax=Desulfitobacterium dichloroeliminans (strain LMG P-21439 / DCA1) TaxID=871963 RepID=L0F7F6_DESDL|nr:DUF1659 domain-containing protein [Desulfitobacterium dichloroeliminans]AGA68955.1 Protein of unknown function (DUF1659) [Desulfitobacterium dichloroeliminans LMG P-21439]
MPVVATPSGAALVLVYQTGLSPTGDPVTRQRTLNNIAYDASEQAVYDAANAIFSLSEYTLLDVYFRRTQELIDEV